MRGYCARCQEYGSDVGEDAWSIIWDRYGGPACGRCGGFIDLGYFVELKQEKQNLSKQ